MAVSIFNPATAVYTPTQASAFAVRQIERMQQNATRGMKLGIPVIASYFAPMMPGQVCAVIAQTSHFKSGFLHAWERALAFQLMDDKRQDEVIVHVSVEECVEEQTYLELAIQSGDDAGKLARGEVQDWSRLMTAAIQVMKIPIFRIGDSLARADDMPNLTMSNMIRAITVLRDTLLGRRLTIAALFFDYLQAFPVDAEIRKGSGFEQQRRLQVREDVYRIRQAASLFDCPAVVAVQAKQHLDGAPGGEMKLPGIYDGEESSSIAQRCDRIITLWLPKMTNVIGSYITVGGESVRVDEDLLYLKVAKQRGGLPSGKTWQCRIDYGRNTIVPEWRRES